MKYKLHIIYSLVGLFLFLRALNAQPGTKDIDSYIQQTIDTVYQKTKVPGIFVALLDNGRRSYFNAGFAVPERKLPFDSTTTFEIGSITKTFTAYVLMSVLHQNGITETSFIFKYLPDSVQKNKSLWKISFLNLMNHTSGLPRLPDNMIIDSSRQPYKNYTEADLFTYLKNCTIHADGKSNYSNLGAGLAGVLAERISGKTYAQLLDQYIFIPFKMIEAKNAVVLSNNKSQGYFAKDDKTVYWDMNVLSPAGGLKCTGNEMLTYLQHMCFPETDQSKLIINKLTTETVSVNEQVAIGLGWHILKLENQPPVYWHNGGTFGFSTFCAFLKNKSKAVLVIVNQFNKNSVSDGLGIQFIKKMMSEE